MLPSEYYALPRAEKAFLVAAIQVKIEAEKEEERKNRLKQNKPRRKR